VTNFIQQASVDFLQTCYYIAINFFSLTMTEDVLHFIWKHGYQQLNQLKTTKGEVVEVISPGIHNFDSGPDFFNAKIKLNDTIWAGNVEIHVNASDLKKHKHEIDPSYDSVILHVVAKNDAEIINSKGQNLPTLEIPYPDKLEWELQRLLSTDSWIPCANELNRINPMPLQIWLSSLCIERIEEKTQQVNLWVEQANGSWEEAFYHSMARSFGLKINALPFELLAKSIPLKVLAKAKDNLFQIEALLFGQSGFLHQKDYAEDNYVIALKKEYDYQSKKHSLTPIGSDLWKFMRLRPVSFPTIRIAQFAMLVHKSSGLFSQMMEIEKPEEINKLLKVEVSDYWKTHYTFGKISASKTKTLGEDTVKVITLNTIVPFMFAYGIARDNQELKDKALILLEALKPESNSVVNGFEKLGIKANNAMFSQALIQLKAQYCDKKKCLFCHIGTGILLKRIG